MQNTTESSYIAGGNENHWKTSENNLSGSYNVNSTNDSTFKYLRKKKKKIYVQNNVIIHSSFIYNSLAVNNPNVYQ